MQQFDFRSPKSFFEKYIADFQGIGLSWVDSDTDWTRKNLGYFIKLGKSRNFEVWPKQAKSKEEYLEEYLVDLCWLVNKPQHYWMELALEQEWKGSFKEIMEDFSKLMDLKAYLKVFVCSPYKYVISDLPSRLAQEISKHKIKIPEEAYLLIIIAEDARLKQDKKIEVEGFEIDYRGNTIPLGKSCFPDSSRAG